MRRNVDTLLMSMTGKSGKHQRFYHDCLGPSTQASSEKGGGVECVAKDLKLSLLNVDLDNDRNHVKFVK